MHVQLCGQAAAQAEEFAGSDSCSQLTPPFPSALAANGVDHPQLLEDCFAYCARSHPHERQLLNLSRRHASRRAARYTIAKVLTLRECCSGTERVIVGVLCAGNPGFRHTISNAAAMTNLTTE